MKGKLKPKDDPGFRPLLGLSSTTKQAMLDELQELNVFSKEAVELLQHQPVSNDEAQQALMHLRKLEAETPSMGETSRAGLVGAAVMPLASLTWRAIAGQKGWSGTGNFWPGGRPLLATAAQGAVMGAGMPVLRHSLEREVEKQKLREYLGENRKGKLRSAIKGTLGV